MRLFAAIELPERVRVELATVRDVVTAEDPAWAGEKWVASENLHITLRFFGEVPDGDAARVVEVVGDTISSLPIPRFEVLRITASPNPRRARMIWAEWDESTGAAETAAHAIAAALPEYSPDAFRPFRAHATLCRARQPKHIARETINAATAGLSCDEAPMSVPAVSVISSRLTPRGPVYATIGTRLFGGR